MLQSKFFVKIKKEFPRDETSVNARFLMRAGFIDKLMAGVYTFLPLGLRVLKNIEKIIRDEMKAVGGQEILMPSLHPKQNWEQTGRWQNFDALLKLKSEISQNEYALGPTHEEIVVPLAANFISSYNDLPQYVFQIQNKFRDEKRVKSGLLRGREFLMKDFYSFHRDEEDLDKYYEKMKKTYEKIFKKVGLGKKTYLTFASGGTFAKYSHEFQTLTSGGEDIIHICQKCKIAINEEIINEQKTCPQCQGVDFLKEKAVEVGNIFKLKTKFSKPFNLSYKDEKGENREVVMGTYGIGLSRLMGTIAESLNDEKGIIWPESVAPFKVHLLALSSSKKQVNSRIAKISEKLYQDLQKNGAEVLYDERRNKSAGEKFAESDLIGIPWRIVVSEKTLAKNSAEVKQRNSGDIRFMTSEKLIKFFLQS